MLTFVVKEDGRVLSIAEREMKWSVVWPRCLAAKVDVAERATSLLPGESQHAPRASHILDLEYCDSVSHLELLHTARRYMQCLAP